MDRSGWADGITFSLDYYRRVLLNGELVTYQNKRELSDRNSLTPVDFRTQTIVPGKARGRLLGGNLTVLTGILVRPTCRTGTAPSCSARTFTRSPTESIA